MLGKVLAGLLVLGALGHTMGSIQFLQATAARALLGALHIFADCARGGSELAAC
jgi:hypothetical protein